jgi:hypothetical protein
MGNLFVVSLTLLSHVSLEDMALVQDVALESDLNTYHLNRSESDLYKACTLVVQILADIDNYVGWPGAVWSYRLRATIILPTSGRRSSRCTEPGCRSVEGFVPHLRKGISRSQSGYSPLRRYSFVAEELQVP